MPVALVTGATGFVGSHVVQALLERQQYKVFALCRSHSPTAIAAAGRVQVIRGDIECEADIVAALEAAQPQYVFHLAGVYAWWQGDSARYDRVNVNGVRNLLRACSRHGGQLKIVHVSTVLAYGRPIGRGFSAESAFDEETPPGPAASQYARSKHDGDCLAQQAFESGTLCGCTCFLACCIGADPKLLDPEKDVMKIQPLVTGHVPAIISSDTVFTYVYVRDAAEAILRAAELAGNGGGERYLVGNQRLQTRAYYDLIAELSGQPRPRYEVPAWLALGAGHAAAWLATRVTRAAPMAPADLVRTAAHGTLLFDASKSERVLGMRYTPIRLAFQEAVDLVTTPAQRLPDDHADASERLLEELDMGVVEVHSSTVPGGRTPTGEGPFLAHHASQHGGRT